MPAKTKKNVQGSPNKVIGYCRVSTSAAQQELGLAAQQQQLEQFCASRNLELLQTFVDETSGATDIGDCKGLLQALAAIKGHGAGVLLVAKRDRLARDVVKSGIITRMVEDVGAKLVSAAGEGSDGDDPASQLLRTLLDAVNQFERATIKTRIKAALNVKQSRGERVGAVPVGKKVVPGSKLLATDQDEVELLQKVKQLRQSGLKLREVAQQLNDEGVTFRGKPLYEVKVHRLLAKAS